MSNQLVPVNGVGSVGLNLDLPTHKAPPPAWSYVRNVRFEDDRVMRTDGHRSILVPTIEPYGLMPSSEAINAYWLYMSQTKARAFNGSTEFDVTRVSGDYNMPVEFQWNGGSFNGLPVLTNGVDLPQYWPVATPGQALEDLIGWPITDTCRILRPFKNNIFALDITKTGTRFPRMIRWSGFASPGNMPDWDVGDPTSEAGELVLAEGEDPLVDGLQMADSFVIYTANETWIARQVGAASVFGLFKRFDATGMLALGCGARFRRRHFLVSQDDIVIHDGTQIESVATESIRTWLFNNLASDYYYLTKVIPVRRHNEMWICIPTTQEPVLDTALIWRWDSNTWTVRDLPNIRAVSEVKYPPDLGEVLNDSEDSITNDSESKTYNDSLSTAILLESITYAPPTLEGIYLVDSTQTFSGTPIQAVVERTGITIRGISKDGRVVLDPNRISMITGIRPRIYSKDPETFQVALQFGEAATPEGEVTWGEEILFTPNQGYMATVRQTGRYLAFRLLSDSGPVWEFDGYDLELSTLGQL